jgi:hypothetical protein
MLSVKIYQHVIEPKISLPSLPSSKKKAIFPYPEAAYFIPRPSLLLLSIGTVVKLSS